MLPELDSLGYIFVADSMDPANVRRRSSSSDLEIFRLTFLSSRLFNHLFSIFVVLFILTLFSGFYIITMLKLSPIKKSTQHIYLSDIKRRSI